MRRLLSIIIIILFLYNTVGYLALFKSLQYGIKKEIKTRIKRKLDDSDLMLIKFPSHPNKQQQKLFHWKEENEFVYEGNMYDVVRQYSIHDTIYFYCIKDSNETELFANLDAQVGQNMASNALSRNLTKLFKLSFDQSFLRSFSFDYCLQSSKSIYCLFQSFNYLSVQKDVETPPPELA